MTLIITYYAYFGNRHNNDTRKISVRLGFHNHYTMAYASIKDIEKAFDKVIKRIYGKVYHRISKLVIQSSLYNYKEAPDIFVY